MVAVSASACGILGLFGEVGSGQIVSRSFSFDDFAAVSAGWGAQVTVRQGDSYEVVLRMDDNLIDLMRVEKRTDELRFYLPPGTAIQRATIEIDIVAPELLELELSGGASGDVITDATNRSVIAQLSGGASLSGSIDADRIVLNASGGSTIVFDGSARSVELDGSGGSRILLFGVDAQDVKATLSGGAHGEVTATGELWAVASGGASLRYDGSPQRVDSHVSGGATVRKR